jgi:hypothetical protein
VVGSKLGRKYLGGHHRWPSTCGGGAVPVLPKPGCFDLVQPVPIPIFCAQLTHRPDDGGSRHL